MPVNSIEISPLVFTRPVLQTIDDVIPRAAGVALRILRLDLIHPLIKGNKWYKLRLNIQAAKDHGYDTLLSFGGAYSNHLYALAVVGRLLGMRTIGVVRGEQALPLNPVLKFALEQGMVLHDVSRTDYREKESPAFAAHLRECFGEFYLIPEGGANVDGVRGCADITASLTWATESPNRYLALACGTGATLAGLLLGRRDGYRILGVSALKGDFLERDVRTLLQNCGASDPGGWSVSQEWHCGGYARFSPELLYFIEGFQCRTGIALEPVYTGKLMRALYIMLDRGEFPPGSEVIALHTGGLQAFVENIPT